MSDIDAYLEAEAGRFEAELCELLHIPSVSTDRKYNDEVRRAAGWVEQQLKSIGLATETIETERHPIVYAESPPVEGQPTMLVYGHYDVQPPEPLDEWISPPFEPTERDGNLYARGATDDKGQMFTHIKAAEAWMKTAGRLPVQLKFLIEGEEEVGSGSLHKYLPENSDKLACDAVVISDTSQFAPGVPAITYGLRGIAYFELLLTGPSQDLHSGVFGGAVTNPATALVRMLSQLLDEDSRVQVPGFYEDVLPLEEREREAFAELPFDEAAFCEQLGVRDLSGEAGYSTLERRWTRPSFDINGIWGGYQGEGGKTVLPAKAGAKFSFRLVPNQNPHKIRGALEQKLRALCPPGIEMELIDMHGSPGVVFSLDSPAMEAAARAIEHGFGRYPVFIREGGSIPIVNEFRDTLGVDVLLLGWGLNDDNTHSPNEKFCLTDFHRGIKSSAKLFEELTK